MSDYGLNGCPRSAEYEKTPDEIVTVPFAWAARLNGETISTATFELPDGLTNVAEAQLAPEHEAEPVPRPTPERAGERGLAIE